MGKSQQPVSRVSSKKHLRNNQVINLLRERGALSRIQIAKISGYSPMAVSQIVDDLLTGGVVRETGKGKSSGGRRPVMVELVPSSGTILGIHFGQHQVFSVMTDLTAKILCEIEELNYLDQPLPIIHERLDQLIGRMTAQDPTRLKNLRGIALALPGIIDNLGRGPSQLVDLYSALTARLEQTYGVPVFIDNTATMKSIAEKWFGVGRPYANYLVVNMGYCLSSGLILGNEVFRGGHGHPGGIGHMKVGGNDELCICNGRGCLGNDVDGLALERKGRGAMQANPAGPLAALAGGDPAQVNAKLMAEAARQGDPACREIFAHMAKQFGKGLSSTINLLNLEAVILTGRLSRASDLFLEDLKASMDEGINPMLRHEFKALEISGLQERAAALGACAVVLENVFSATSQQMLGLV